MPTIRHSDCMGYTENITSCTCRCDRDFAFDSLREINLQVAVTLQEINLHLPKQIKIDDKTLRYTIIHNCCV